jgi:hypothetical protein
MCKHLVPALKLNLKHRTSQNDFHDTLDLDRLIIAVILDLLLERTSAAFSSRWSTSSCCAFSGASSFFWSSCYNYSLFD